MQEPHQQQFVIALCEWIENHLQRDIALAELAQRSGYSVWHMQTLFRANTGMAIGRYIRERKLTKAVHRLRESNDRILDIALDFGFNSQSQFSTLFKKYYGITPQTCRNQPDIPLKLTAALCPECP